MKRETKLAIAKMFLDLSASYFWLTELNKAGADLVIKALMVIAWIGTLVGIHTVVEEINK